MRAHPRADLRHVTGRAGDFCGRKEIDLRSQGHPFGNAIGKRAAGDAACLRALDAAAGLFADGSLVVQAVNLVEIGNTLVRRPLGGTSAVELSPGVLRLPIWGGRWFHGWWCRGQNE